MTKRQKPTTDNLILREAVHDRASPNGGSLQSYGELSNCSSGGWGGYLDTEWLRTAKWA